MFGRGSEDGRLELTPRNVVVPGLGERWVRFKDVKKGDVVTGKEGGGACAFAAWRPVRWQ